VAIDRRIRENFRADLRVDVSQILRRYGYPPDEQEASRPRDSGPDRAAREVPSPFQTARRGGPLAGDPGNARRSRNARDDGEPGGVTIDVSRREVLLASTPLGSDGKGAREIAELLVERRVNEGPPSSLRGGGRPLLRRREGALARIPHTSERPGDHGVPHRPGGVVRVPAAPRRGALPGLGPRGRRADAPRSRARAIPAPASPECGGRQVLDRRLYVVSRSRWPSSAPSAAPPRAPQRPPGRSFFRATSRRR